MDKTITFIIEDLFQEKKKDGPIHKTFMELGINNVNTFTIFHPSDVSSTFFYTDEHGKTTPLGKVTWKQMENLLTWFHTSGVLTQSDWFNLTPETAFKAPPLPGAATTTAAPTKPPATVLTAAAPYPTDQLAEFRKGIRRSIDDYKDFTKDQQWKSFKNHLISLAGVHDISDVLDEKYKPNSSTEKALFEEKQKFMFSVFREHLQTARSKRVLCQYAKTFDAQAIYQGLLEDYEGGTNQQIEEERLEEVARTYKLTEQWNKPLVAFLTSWSLKIMDYEECADTNMPDSEKRKLLSAAIRHHGELYQAVTSATLLEQNLRRMSVSSMTQMSFKAFYKHIEDHAIILDRNWREKNAAATRKANQSKQNSASNNNKSKDNSNKCNKKNKSGDKSG